jgi:hypothetical protein
MIGRRKSYAITPKGRAVLHGPTAWGLSRYLRDALALCDPQTSFDQLNQFMPRDSLNAALYALRELGLIDGPAVEAPATAHCAALRPPVARRRSETAQA